MICLILDLRPRVVCLGPMQALDASKAVSWGNNPCVAEVLFYADIALDLKQLKLFYDEGLVDYMAFNAFGLLIPPIVTLHEAFEWCRKPSPELNFFQSRIQSEILQKIVIVAAVASQSHVLLLVMLSIRFRSTPGRVWIGKFGMLGWSCCERNSTNKVADSFNLIVDAVSMRKRQTRHASYRHLLDGVWVRFVFWVLRLNMFFSYDTSCRAGTPLKLGSTLYCEEPRMQRLARSGKRLNWPKFWQSSWCGPYANFSLSGMYLERIYILIL